MHSEIDGLDKMYYNVKSTSCTHDLKQHERNMGKSKRQQLKTFILMKIIQTTVTCYDILTFPVYFLFQRPWQHWRSPVLSELENKDDPYSSYVRTLIPEIKIDIGDGKTIVELLEYAFKKFGSKKMYGTREVLSVENEEQKDGKMFKKLYLGDYKWMDFNEANHKIGVLCNSLLAIGAKPKEFIIIFAETRVEWFLTAQACFRINIPIVTLYATLGEEAIIHGINETGVSHIISSQELLPKLKKIIHKIPTVKKIVMMEGYTKEDITGFPENVSIIPFSKFEKLGVQEVPENMPEPPTPEDIAIVMYTSGSTGIPKGVIINHRNIAMSVTIFSRFGAKIEPGDTYIGYLPLAHMLELCAETVMACAGVPVGYSSPYTFSDNASAVKKGCKGDIAILKPAGFAAVPLILDKIRKGIMEVVESRGEFATTFFNFCIAYSTFWYKKGFNTPILDRIIFKKVRDMLGGNLRAICVGGAPLPADTAHFIRACLGVQVVQGYGMTETLSCCTMEIFESRDTGKVGAPLCNLKVRLVDWEEGGYRATDKPNPRGELVIGGDFVSVGYFKKPELTNEAFREEMGERWFYSGDIGEVLPDGQWKIIDRKKDLVKLQFGEYISLGRVESTINTFGLVNNACVLGNGLYNFLIAMIEPNKSHIEKLARSLGKGDQTWAEMCSDEEINKEVSKQIKEHCLKFKLQRFEVPEKFKLVAEEWLPDTGLVTAAFKIRRKAIEQFYQDDINNMYD